MLGELKELESAGQRGALAVHPLTADYSGEPVRSERPGVGISSLGAALLDENEAAVRAGGFVKCQHRVASGSGAGEGIEHYPVGRTPDLDELLEKSKRLNRLETVIFPDDRSELVDPRLGVTGLLVLPGGRAKDRRELMIIVSPEGGRDDALLHVLEVPLVRRTPLAVDAEVHDRPRPLCENRCA